MQTEKITIPELVHQDLCISCGQCVAVCPQGVITHSDFPAESIQPIDHDQQPTPEQVLALLKTRRSIRAFRDKPVDEGLIRRIIDGARFAPSAHNAQSTEFLVVQDKGILQQIPQLVADYLRYEIKRFSNPIFRTAVFLVAREEAGLAIHELPTFKRIVEAVESGRDPVLFQAPILLVFHGQRDVGYAEVNASLALQNAALVAHASGVGNFFTGFMVAACKRDSHIPRLLGIPATNRVFGALALGYPIPKFKHWIERKPPQVQWLGETPRQSG